MTNRKLVPLVVAPEDECARQQGEALEAHLRSTIGALWHGCRVSPQPRWLFSDIERGRPVSVSQMFRAFAILARHPEISEAAITAAAEQFSVLMIGQRMDRVAGLEELLADETVAQAEADVLQMRAAIADGHCVVTNERALEATVRHRVAAARVQTRLAAHLTEARSVRRPSRLVASRS